LRFPANLVAAGDVFRRFQGTARMDPTWYRTFFSGVVNEFWQQVMPAEHTRAEVEFAAGELRLTAGSRVLDVPCGHGRHTVELARRGYRVTGIDISADNLARAERAATEAGVRLDLRQADMGELGVLPAFDAAVTLGNSFGYLDHPGTSRLVQSVAAALQPGGRWLIDTGMTAESLLVNLRDELEYPSPTGIGIKIKNRYLVDISCLETEMDFIGGGQTETRRFWHWVFTVGEIRRMLAAAGLNVVAMYAGINREPFAVGCPFLYLVAEKIV
jgi:SAM-dependent methyltransferase